jgi:aerobic C4-dicarboxylate transport protein
MNLANQGGKGPLNGPSGDAVAEVKSKPFWAQLWLQVLVAIAAGVALGWVNPALGVQLKPLGDGFIALIRMMIGPVVFCTVVHGIASMGDLGKAGRIGLKAILYFEVVSTLALLLGLLAGHLLHPGLGFVAQPAAAAGLKTVSGFVEKAQGDGVTQHLLNIIPTTYLDAFAKGDLLQVLLVSILTGVAIPHAGKGGQVVLEAIEAFSHVFFRIIAIVVWLAPLGALGAMAYTVGAFGPKALINLAQLVGTFYLTAALFVVIGLGTVARLAGFSIFKYLSYIRDELLIVLGTSSSETVLPSLMRKLERAGASEPVVGLVVPTGYSFNLDGTNIYMTLSILFLAQATGTHLTWQQEATIIAISMLTSKGASGVTGAGFITLAATLAIVPQIPIASLAMILGVDRFMSQCRSITNLIGNGVATLVVARWEGELDMTKLKRELDGADPGAHTAEASA